MTSDTVCYILQNVILFLRAVTNDFFPVSINLWILIICIEEMVQNAPHKFWENKVISKCWLFRSTNGPKPKDPIHNNI